MKEDCNRLDVSSLVELKFTIWSFHQCPSLISLKLNFKNYLFWHYKIQHLIKSLDITHHIDNAITLDENLLRRMEAKSRIKIRVFGLKVMVCQSFGCLLLCQLTSLILPLVWTLLMKLEKLNKSTYYQLQRKRKFSSMITLWP